MSSGGETRTSSTRPRHALYGLVDLFIHGVEDESQVGSFEKRHGKVLCYVGYGAARPWRHEPRRKCRQVPAYLIESHLVEQRGRGARGLQMERRADKTFPMRGRTRPAYEGQTLVSRERRPL